MRKIVSWGEVNYFLRVVSEKCAETNIDGVYGLPRGGLVLAVMLSHKLKKPLLLAPTSNSLIVDDICDSGESLLHYYSNSSAENETKRPVIATMFYKNNPLVKPDIYLYEKKNDWIVFPWEE